MSTQYHTCSNIMIHMDVFFLINLLSLVFLLHYFLHRQQSFTGIFLPLHYRYFPSTSHHHHPFTSPHKSSPSSHYPLILLPAFHRYLYRYVPSPPLPPPPLPPPLPPLLLPPPVPVNLNESEWRPFCKLESFI